MKKLLLTAFFAAEVIACTSPDDDGSDLRAADAFNYTGSIRISMADGGTDPAGEEFRLAFATDSNVQSLGLCPLRTINDAANCRPGVNGYYATDFLSETNGKRFFRAKNVVVVQENLILALQGVDAQGTAVDTRIVRFNKGTPGSTTTPPNTNTSATNFETKGTGGRTGNVDGSFGQGGKYLHVVPTDVTTKAYGLLVFLHGSTASNYREFATENAPVAAQNGLMSVSVLAPNGQGWNEGNGNDAARYLDELIEGKLFKEYNIDKRKIFFHGQSSGAGFLSSHFVALYGKNFGGGALMLCGASQLQAQVAVTDEMKRTFRLYYDLTVDDRIWTDQLQPAIQGYRQAGLTVESDNSKPGGHCAFDQQGILREKIPQMMRANGL